MHKYPCLYLQCESTFGYDDIVERLGENRVLLTILNTNCMMNKITLFIEDIHTKAYNELIDFLDGNGFIIQRFNDSNTVHIIPIERKNI